MSIEDKVLLMYLLSKIRDDYNLMYSLSREMYILGGVSRKVSDLMSDPVEGAMETNDKDLEMMIVLDMVYKEYLQFQPLISVADEFTRKVSHRVNNMRYDTKLGDLTLDEFFSRDRLREMGYEVPKMGMDIILPEYSSINMGLTQKRLSMNRFYPLLHLRESCMMYLSLSGDLDVIRYKRYNDPLTFACIIKDIIDTFNDNIGDDMDKAMRLMKVIRALKCAKYYFMMIEDPRDVLIKYSYDVIYTSLYHHGKFIKGFGDEFIRVREDFMRIRDEVINIIDRFLDSNVNVDEQYVYIDNF